ncbi:MAG: cation diffusion facilitator family transporter [Gammaproteobacteria bacterium]
MNPHSHSPLYEQQSRKRAIVLWGAFINASLGIVKLIAGWLGHSHALMADGMHSLSDLLTDFLVWFAAHYGSQAADDDHPYGHGRIETAATMAMALFLILIGLAIIGDAGYNLWSGIQIHQPHQYVLWLLIASVLLKEGLFRWTLHVAREVNSELLRANAWHHRSDAASSVVALVGVVGTWWGLDYLDLVAACLVGAMISKMGIGLAWDSVRELVDTAVDETTLHTMRRIIKAVPGVRALHCLRTRLMAGAVYVDVHVLVMPALTVSEGHFIAQQVQLNLLNQVKAIQDVTVHVDPEDDGVELHSYRLPSRTELLPILTQHWQSLYGADQIQMINLHYIAGKIHIEIHLPMTLLPSIEEASVLAQRYQQVVSEIDYVAGIKLLFTAAALS